MSSQTDPATHPLPPTNFTRSSSKRSKIPSEVRDYVSRRRAWLCLSALVLLLLMCLGIVFAAHHYYVAFGGQGFLRLRDRSQSYRANVLDVSKAYLPTRKLAQFDGADMDLEGSRRRRRSVPMEVPYYVCGDQQASCDAYGQARICCPVKMTCHPTHYTASNIFCCNSNGTTLECDESWVEEPKCLPTYFECLGVEGGGCCPMGSLCSPNGCITTTRPMTLSSKTAAAAATGPVTVVEIPAATATIVKQGEVAQRGVGTKEDVRLRLCLPYSCTAILVFIAALMGFL